MKKVTFIFLFFICLECNAQTGGGHAVKIADWKIDTRPYPVRVFNQFLDWLYRAK